MVTIAKIPKISTLKFSTRGESKVRHIGSNWQVPRVVKHDEMEKDNLMQAGFFGSSFKEHMFIINGKELSGATYMS